MRPAAPSHASSGAARACPIAVHASAHYGAARACPTAVHACGHQRPSVGRQWMRVPNRGACIETRRARALGVGSRNRPRTCDGSRAKACARLDEARAARTCGEREREGRGAVMSTCMRGDDLTTHRGRRAPVGRFGPRPLQVPDEGGNQQASPVPIHRNQQASSVPIHRNQQASSVPIHRNQQASSVPIHRNQQATALSRPSAVGKPASACIGRWGACECMHRVCTACTHR